MVTYVARRGAYVCVTSPAQPHSWLGQTDADVYMGRQRTTDEMCKIYLVSRGRTHLASYFA